MGQYYNTTSIRPNYRNEGNDSNPIHTFNSNQFPKYKSELPL